MCTGKTGIMEYFVRSAAKPVLSRFFVCMEILPGNLKGRYIHHSPLPVTQPEANGATPYK